MGYIPRVPFAYKPAPPRPSPTAGRRGMNGSPSPFMGAGAGGAGCFPPSPTPFPHRGEKGNRAGVFPLALEWERGQGERDITWWVLPGRLTLVRVRGCPTTKDDHNGNPIGVWSTLFVAIPKRSLLTCANYTKTILLHSFFSKGAKS